MSGRHQPENGADSPTALITIGAARSKEYETLNAYMAASDEDADEAWEAYLKAVANREAADR